MIGPVLRATQTTSHRVLRTAERLSRGARRAAFDLAPPESPTPRLPVWSRDKARLFRYVTPDGVTRRDAPPLLLVMSLVTTSLVFDLQEHNSLVRRFLDEGYDVYLLDWGVPDAVDSANTLRDLLRRVPAQGRASDAARVGGRGDRALRLLPRRGPRHAQPRRSPAHAGARDGAARHARST